MFSLAGLFAAIREGAPKSDGPTRNAHPTKRGPGRRHKSGQAHGAAPAQDKGAPAGFVQHRNDGAAARRAVKRDIGARQYRKQRRALALAAREAS